MTDKQDESEKEIVESQKLSERDKKEIQNGACVNCAIISFLFVVVTILALAF